MKKIILGISSLFLIFSLAGCKKNNSSTELSANKEAFDTAFYKDKIEDYQTKFDMDKVYLEDSSLNYDENQTKHYEVYLAKEDFNILVAVDASALTNKGGNKSRIYANYTALANSISDYSSIINILNGIDSISNFDSKEKELSIPDEYFNTEASQRVLAIEYTVVFVKYVEYQSDAQFPTLYTCVFVPTAATLTTLADNKFADSSLNEKYNTYFKFSGNAVSDYEEQTITK